MFDLGNVIPTNLALRKAKSLEIDLMSVLQHHAAEDWPDLSVNQCALNAAAIQMQRVVYARYKIKGNVFIVETDLRIPETRIKMVEEV